MKNILIPTDFLKNFWNTLIDILNISNASLSTLSISKIDTEFTDLQKKNKEFLNDCFGEIVSHSFYFLKNQTIEEALQCFVELRNSTMITMIAKP